MNMNKYISLAVIALTCSLPVLAQENSLQSRSLTVEGSYNPNTGHAGKMMPVPDRLMPERNATIEAVYVKDTLPPVQHYRKSMTVFSESSNDVTYKPLLGFVSLGYGARNVLEGDAYLAWRMSDRDIIEADANLDGFNSEVMDGWKSHRLAGDIRLDYTHFFDEVIIGATAEGGYSSRNFREGIDQRKMGNDSLNQQTNHTKMGVYVKSAPKNRIQWNVGASYQDLGRRGLILGDIIPFNEEGIVRIQGDLSVPFQGGIASLGYRQKTTAYRWTGMSDCEYEDFSTFTLIPSWSRNWDRLKISLGASLDARTARGNVFMFSPKASLEYKVNDVLTLMTKANGGLIDNSALSLAEISPYWSEDGQLRDGYVIADLSAGLTLNAGGLFNLNAWAGYRDTYKDVFQVPDYEGQVVTSVLKQHNSYVFYAHTDMSFVPDSRFAIQAWVDGCSWVGKYGGGLLAYKPVMEAGLFTRMGLTQALNASLGYRFVEFSKVGDTRINPINDLTLRLDWDITDHWAAYLKGGHLLGGDWECMAGYPEIGAFGLAGVKYTF